MNVKKTWAAILAFTMICGAATGCTNSNGSSTSDSESAAANAGTSTTDTITLVWYPNESAEDYQAARDEVGKLIEKATGKKVEQKLTTDYAIAIESLSNGTAQIGCCMGAEGYCQAKTANDAVNLLFVQSGESGTLDDALYYSFFAVKSENSDEYKNGDSYSIDNIKGKKMSFVSIIGPSGAGKSTILRCINRLIDATEGKIIYDGEDIMSLRKGQLRNVRTKTGMIFQHYNLVERLSVMENVLHGRLGQKSTFSGMIGHYTESEKEKAFSILSELGLADQAYKRCDALSGGQKQRVGIARAIMQEPKLILCDEPIASLDPKASKTIMDHLAQINQTRKITCIVNLHQVDVAMKYSQRILGIAAGKLVFDGTPSELTQEKIHEIYQSNAQDLMLDMQGEAV